MNSKSIILLFFCSCLGFSLFGKGSHGKFILKGIAYNHKVFPIRNSIIELEFGRTKQQIRTNYKGEYSIEIDWEIPCMSGHVGEITSQDIENSIAYANPKFLIFKFKSKKLEIENYFYTHIIGSDFSVRSALIFKLNLKF